MGNGNGKGMPWGPMESGRPDTPAYEAQDTNIQHFMDSPQIRQAIEEMATRGGDAQRAYMAGQSKMLGSGTTSGSNSGALANIAALAEKNRNTATTGLAQAQMDAFNRARQAANEFKQRQYATDLGAYNNEEANRGQAVGSIGTGIGSLLALLAL
jgi:hypothetical protein